MIPGDLSDDERDDEDALLDLLVPGLVHDIRSPLQQLTWNVQFLNRVIDALLESSADPGQHPRLAGWLADLPQARGHLRGGLRRLTALADNLLALAGGPPEALDLREVARVAAALARPVVARRVVVQLATGETPVVAMVHRTRLVRAVIRTVDALTGEVAPGSPLPQLELAVLSAPDWQSIRVTVEDDSPEADDLSWVEQVCAAHRGRLALDGGPGRRVATLKLPPWSPSGSG